jgi:CheY-like chemotaxis protein
MGDAKIMVVEDEGIVSIDIRNILTKLGYSIACVAFSGEEAVDKIKNKCQPDLILMDIGLKGNLDGIDAAKQIKPLCSAPVIFLTGFADDHTLSRAKEAGPAGYLVKPINEDELLEILAKHLPT